MGGVAQSSLGVALSRLGVAQSSLGVAHRCPEYSGIILGVAIILLVLSIPSNI